MEPKRKVLKNILPLLCILQSVGVIGFCLYKLYTDSGKSELWIAIICSVLGCVSGKAHLATKKKDVILPSNPIGLESEVLSKQ